LDRKAQLERELARIIEILVRDYKPERIILFGSLAKGNLHDWSDIDIAVIKDTPRRFLDRISDVLLLTRPEVGLNIVVYTPQEIAQMAKDSPSFWVSEIASKGKVLYDRAA